MKKKEFDTIMKEITGGLSGDTAADIRYLKSQAEKYREHEYSQEIARACGRIMYSLLPEDKKGEIADAFKKDYEGHKAVIDEVRFKIYKKEYPEALKIIESYIKKFEDAPLFVDDEVSEYHNFKEFMEQLIYDNLYKPEKDLRIAEIDYSEMYLLYGSLLYEMKRHEDALKALDNARRWNPASADLAFEYAENLKVLQRLDEYKACTLETFKLAFKPGQLARCYRNLGYYYIEQQEYLLAVCCEEFSLQFEDSNVARSELFYISKKCGQNFNTEIDIIEDLLRKNGIPFGPDEDILKIAYAYGRHFFEDKEYEGALYCLNIFDAFIDDDGVKKMIFEIKNLG